MALGGKFPPFVRGHALVPPPDAPDVNLRLILTKIHMTSRNHLTDIEDVPGGGGKLITIKI
jgi:hypothetical protein